MATCGKCTVCVQVWESVCAWTFVCVCVCVCVCVHSCMFIIYMCVVCTLEAMQCKGFQLTPGQKTAIKLRERHSVWLWGNMQNTAGSDWSAYNV